MRSRKSKSAAPDRSQGTEKEPSAAAAFPVVAIGASAGGLEAYKEFFHALAPDTGMAFVLVQHLDPSHQSLLAGIIAKSTNMQVEEIRAGVKLRPNRVYVIPHDALLGISEGAFTLAPRGKAPGQHLTVNFFMNALATERKHRAIGVIFSGTGTDGALGVAAIKAEGGIIFAQEPANAKYDGMPRSAIASGSVDFILHPQEIARDLGRIHRHAYVRHKDEAAIERTTAAGDFEAILDVLRKAGGVDFHQYKPNTIHRRALRRMVILKLDSLREYVQHLKQHPDEAEKLYEDVLIPVTSFFRDLEAFEALKSQVYPALVKDKGNKGTIRMWAPGCSTGEETYSLAMTLLEFLGDKAASYQVQIFGTDLNEKGIQKARAGVYRENIAEEISAERLRRFFVRVDEGYRINKSVREMCVFARQNLAGDPPFSQMNLVACRNVLIYLQPALQKKIFPILHYALKPSGFLVLGSSESAAAFPNLFSPVDQKNKIYAKKSTLSRLHYDFSQTHYPAGSGADVTSDAPGPKAAPEAEFDMQAEADRVVLNSYAPVGVVINSGMEVVQFRGRTTPYLEPGPGKPSLNVLKLAQNGLAAELRSLINTARKKGEAVKKNGVQFEGNGRRRMLNLSVSPLAGKNASSQEQYFLVLFEDVTPQEVSGPAGRTRSAAKGGVEKTETKRLRQELAAAQDALRSTTESENAVREEFQSANEEILSANEELQSSNEELETSKEELQSANEELSTLNEELRHKNTELHGLSNDLVNVLNSTRIPLVMLDRDLRIRRLTPRSGVLLKAASSDIGRPVSDIRLNIKVADLETMIKRVLDGLQPAERDVQDHENRWHTLHILPYRTLDNKIDGVVLVLQDINTIKAANEQLRKSSEFFHGIIDTVREPLLVLDSDLRVIAANASFLQAFQVSPEETVDKFLYRLGNEQWNIPRLRALLEEVLPKDQSVRDYEVEHEFEKIGRRKMLVNAQRLMQANERQPLILLAFEDVTRRKQAEQASSKLAAIVKSSDDAIVSKDLNGIINSWNAGAERLFGYTAEEALGQPAIMLIPPERSGEEAEILACIRRGEVFDHYQTVRRRKDGTLFDASVTVSPVRDDSGRIVGASKIARDISEHKKAAEALQKSEERYRTLFDSIDEGFCIIEVIFDKKGKAVDFRFLEVSPSFEKQTGLKDAQGKRMRELAPKHEEYWFEIYGKIAMTGEAARFQRQAEQLHRWYDVYAFRFGEPEKRQVAILFNDITERKLSQAALIKSEKLAISGRLAATLAHEINNPLQAVTNLMALLGRSSKLEAQDREYTTLALKELGRVVHLIRQSLGFYQEAVSPVAVNLEEVLGSILSLYDKQIEARHITVTKQYKVDGTVISYPGQIRQVFSTLLVNAMDASHRGGQITVRGRTSADWKDQRKHGLRITIADNGAGIPARDAGRIFEPFFTTKAEKGTGLGLWVAQGIVQRLGGSIRVRSRVHPQKGGTCFSVFLPELDATRA